MADESLTEPRLLLDHIAVVARNVEEGCAWVKQALGVDVPPGGTHPAMGTHNHLMNLGPGIFLEVISINPDAPAPGRPRWFGLDSFDASPRLATWVVATKDMHSTLPLMPASVGPAIPLTRGDLSWTLTVPDDGSRPLDGAFPAIIEWPDGSPADAMPDLRCRLRSLVIGHPQADAINLALEGRLIDPRVRIQSGPVFKMSAEIDTPTGVRTL